MNIRMKLGILLAGVSVLFLVTAGAFAYAQSMAQQSSRTSCGSMMNNNGGMGMMGGMNRFGSMGQQPCESQMEHENVGQCQDMMNQLNATQSCR